MNRRSCKQSRVSQAAQPGAGEDTSEVARLWLRWTEVFEKAASKGRQSLWMSEKEYRQLHHNLIGALARLKKADGLHDAERDVCRRMEHQCRPWLSLEPLSHTDRLIVRDVALTARNLYSELVGHNRSNHRWMVVMWMFVGLLVVGAIVAWALTMGLDGESKGVMSWLAGNVRGLWYRACHSFGRQSFGAWIAVAVALMVAVGFWTLRSSRSF